jgi:hypothetical protein
MLNPNQLTTKAQNVLLSDITSSISNVHHATKGNQALYSLSQTRTNQYLLCVFNYVRLAANHYTSFA